MSWTRPTFALLMVVLFFPVPVAARAATGIAAAAVAPAAPQRVTEGTLLFRAAEGTAMPAPLLTTDVDLHVTGPIARAIVRQEFCSRSASARPPIATSCARPRGTGVARSRTSAP
jgi:hypothetical protein